MSAPASNVIEEYNSPVYPPRKGGSRLDGFKPCLTVGQTAPDFSALRLDGTATSLSEFTANGPVVLEFGSIT